MLTLLTDVDVYAPEPLGSGSILMAGERVVATGSMDADALTAAGVEVRSISGENCIAIPGLIDPHVHLLGGSGEEGFASQTPEIHASELAAAGVTTVVGLLGVDATTRTMPALLGRIKAINGTGLTAYGWSGGYGFPHATITGSVRDDVVLIEELIGAGEIAIADRRSMEPTARDLARLATDCHVAGSLSGKCGLLHLHVGEGSRRLAIIRECVDSFDVEAGWFYPTHLDRNDELLREAVDLNRRGMPVDLDLFEENLPKWIRLFQKAGGNPGLLTVSSDAAINSPRTVLEQILACADEKILPLEAAVALATANTADVLKLHRKGRIREGMEADVVLLHPDSHEIVKVFARGEVVFDAAQPVALEPFLRKSNREAHLVGDRSPSASRDEEE